MTKDVESEAGGDVLRCGFVAIIGAPNAGKSTLLNYLAGRKAAITSEVPGTTRDIIEVRMNIGGHAVTLLDTAGVRTSGDEVEKLGVELAKSRAEAADLRIFLIDGGEDPVLVPMDHDIVVAGKADLGRNDDFAVSGRTGAGVEQLLLRIETELAKMVSGAGLAIRERHRVAIIEARDALFSVKEMLSKDGLLDVTAEELRFSMSRVISIVGHIDVEDLLDDIFSSFCIGK